MLNLLNYDLPAMQALCLDFGEQPFRAKQLLQWVHQQGVTDISKMHTLSQSFRQRLSAQAEVKGLTMVSEKKSDDGTIKWLLACDDGNHIETVMIPAGTRRTLCISSQVGCALKCDFCATGDQGFARNLTVAEVIGQLWFAWHQLRAQGFNHPITNVVMMGMGEPLLNYDAVVSALRLMLDDLAYGLSKYRVTLSTSGVVPKMLRLSKDVPVALAVSLHAPTDELRNHLVPINRKYPLADLRQACVNYFTKESKRHITFEYVMLHQVNDQLSHAKALRKWLDGLSAKVNLIPYNHYTGGRYQCSSAESIKAFQSCLVAAGIHTTVRQTRGDDVTAACGQLKGEFQDRTLRTAAGRAWVMQHQLKRHQKRQVQ
jgi:23S rRNA (adenine2503-C2)-methyltransferase